MRVKAVGQPMYYGRQMRPVGVEYDMDPREEAEAKILAALGKIEIVTDAKPNTGRKAEAPTYQAATLKAQDEQVSGDKPTSVEPMTTENAEPLADTVGTGERKRYYRRRDMKAEGQ